MRSSASSPGTSSPQLTLTGGGRALPLRQHADRLLRLFRRLQRLDRRRRLLRPAVGPAIALPESRQDRRQRQCRPEAVGGHRLHPPAQPDLADHRRSSGLRDLVARLPARRRQPARHAAALRRRLHQQLRARLEDELARQPAPLQRRDLPARLDQYPIVLPRRQRPHRDPATPATPASAASSSTSRRRPAPRASRSASAAPINDAETTNATRSRPPERGCRSPRASRAMPGSATNSRSRGGMAGPRPAQRRHEGSRTRDLQADQQRHLRRSAEPPIWSTSAPASRTSAGRVELFARNLFDARGALGASIQCNELICGDPGGLTAIGPKIYTFVATPRTIGIRFGVRF